MPYDYAISEVNSGIISQEAPKKPILILEQPLTMVFKISWVTHVDFFHINPYFVS